MNIRLGTDGIDFINIYSKASTPVGRYLSNWSKGEFHTLHGDFKSIEGLIYYMGSFDPKLRDLYGYEAKKYGQSVDKGHRSNTMVFRTVVQHAMMEKWLAMEEDMKNTLCYGRYTELPLVHYYEYGGNRITVPEWDWQIKLWEKFRKEEC